MSNQPPKSLKDELQKFLAGEVLQDDKTLTTYSQDASLFMVRPEVVVFPQHSRDLTALIEFVNEDPKRRLSLTPRAAGTDMSGGPLSESIVLDFTKHFNRIKNVTKTDATTQPGVFYRDFDKATRKLNRIMPSYPASRELCAVGGMVANNSGGEKSLTFGTTEQWVSELKVMLRNGKEYSFSPLSSGERKSKMKLKTLEGEVYRKTFELIERHYDFLQKAKPKVSKNSTGYFLWDVWDKEKDIFDFTKLFTGSQGTLGLITEITFNLIEPKPFSRLVVIPLRQLDRLGEIVNAVLQFKPESFETYDDHTLNLAIRYLPDISKRLKIKNIFSMFGQFLPEITMMITGRGPSLVLLAEFTGSSDEDTLAQATVASDALTMMHIDSRITKTIPEAQKYWAIRRESFNLLRHHVKEKHTAPFIDDIVVNPEKLPEFLPKLNEVMSHYNLIYTLAGHIGNGNFHIIPLMDLNLPETRKIIPELSQKVFDLVFKYEGSMSGEHNDGLIRTPFLKQMYGPRVCHLFAETKKIFDPNNIFNPHKKIDTSMSQAMKMIKTDPKLPTV